MTQKEYRAALKDVVYLVACALNEKKPSEKRIDKMEMPSVLAAAKRHSLGAAVGMVLASVGVYTPEMTEELAKAKRKNALLDLDRTILFEKLDSLGIWHMPLKGAVLASLYPEYGMRQMADNDILVDASRREDIRSVMDSLGFTTVTFGHGNHDIYHKEPVSNFEIHPVLFPKWFDDRFYHYYEHVEDRLLGDGYEKHFSREDFYIYMIAHEYRHFSTDGTGLRSLADTYIYLKQYPLRYKEAALGDIGKESFLDLAYVETETRKLGIDAYERQNRSLALHLFGRQTPTEEDKAMLAYIVDSGTYGTMRHNIENMMMKKRGGALRYMLYRFSVPVSRENPWYESFARVYPVFYKYKILLPALPFYRTFRSIFQGRFTNEAKTLRSIKVRSV